MALNVLVLSRYGPLGASSRYRMYQYLPFLREQGFAVTVAPLLDDAYLEQRYSGRRVALLRLTRSYGRRIADLLTSGRFDLVWLEKEMFPWIPAWIERALMRVGVPYVVDYDDAVFHNYDRHRLAIVRRLMGTKIDDVMRGAALVVVCNRYLAERARVAGARWIELVPTTVELARYARPTPPLNTTFTIGWIGTPWTARYLELVRPALHEVCRNGQARFVAIGAGSLNWDEVPVEVVPWSEATEVAELQKLDVGIMPLPNSPFERGKCGLKLIQYMACGRPVVASPVGVNCEIVLDGVNGFTAANNDEWVTALRTLRDDPAHRERMGRVGRRNVEEKLSLEITAPRLAGLLRNTAAGDRSSRR
jgi:glycosyltransferase involved in cell wall biosynthesis